MRAILIAILALIASASTPTKAHEWYDSMCCDDRDCAPVTKMVLANRGWMMTTKHGTVYVPQSLPPDRWYASQDGQVHLCIGGLGHDLERGWIKGEDPPYARCVYWPVS